ncbi:MAG: PIG-L family deacetylase, partial [Gemmatimonadota bacterium]|nr:PIG-L family deacetylase [Gemmatimonadota bacterium]
GLDAETMARRREREAEEAAAALGVTDLVQLGFRERAWSEESVSSALAPLLAGASILYAPSPVDYHPDHLGLARLLAPLVPGGARVRTMEIGVPLGPALVNLVADVRPVAGRKAAALAAHASQAATLRSLERLVRYRAALHGPAAGEVFWELASPAYARLVADARWDWRRTPFRAIRPRPCADLRAYTTGHRARLGLRDLAEGRMG